MDATNKKHKKILYRVIKGDTPIFYSKEMTEGEDKTENIKEGLSRYEEIKGTNAVKKLTENMNVENADKP